MAKKSSKKVVAPEPSEVRMRLHPGAGLAFASVLCLNLYDIVELRPFQTLLSPGRHTPALPVPLLFGTYFPRAAMTEAGRVFLRIIF